MRIGIDINPTIEKVTGKGFFLRNLIENLGKLDKKNKYLLFGAEFPSYDVNDNFSFVKIDGNEGIFRDLKCAFLARFKYRTSIFISVKSIYIPILHPRTILEIHDIGPISFPQYYSPKKQKFYRRLLPISLRRAAYIVTPTNSTKNSIVNHFNIEREKIIKVPGAPPSWTEQEIGIEDKKRVIKKYQLPLNYLLFVGTIEPRKNLKNLIEAWKIFKAKSKIDYKLVIVGKKGYKYDEIFQKVINLNLTHDVIFSGHIDTNDLKPVYSLARALVLPSYFEGFALTALEAMKCEIPVLCNNKGAIKETVDDACLSLDPDDPNDIANSILKICNRDSLRQKLITKGVDQVMNYSWTKSTKKFISIIESLS
jgi:glycosyltransferase involved in cell wall biosynthesis